VSQCHDQASFSSPIRNWAMISSPGPSPPRRGSGRREAGPGGPAFPRFRGKRIWGTGRRQLSPLSRVSAQPVFPASDVFLLKNGSGCRSRWSFPKTPIVDLYICPKGGLRGDLRDLHTFRNRTRFPPVSDPGQICRSASCTS